MIIDIFHIINNYLNLHDKFNLFQINKELFNFQKEYFKILKTDLDYIIYNNINIIPNKYFSNDDLWYIMLNTSQYFNIDFSIDKLMNFKYVYNNIYSNPNINFCVMIDKINNDRYYDIILGINDYKNEFESNNIIKINQIVNYNNIFKQYKNKFEMEFIDISKYKLHNINSDRDDIYVLVGNFRNSLRIKYYNDLKYIKDC
jgi:hypothetical protein